jgi:hypothetical protein
MAEIAAVSVVSNRVGNVIGKTLGTHQRLTRDQFVDAYRQAIQATDRDMQAGVLHANVLEAVAVMAILLAAEVERYGSGHERDPAS